MDQGCAATSLSVIRSAGSTVSIPVIKATDFLANRVYNKENRGAHKGSEGIRFHGCSENIVPFTYPTNSGLLAVGSSHGVSSSNHRLALIA